MKIHSDYREINYAQIIDLYVENGWGKAEDYSEERITLSFANSTFCYFAIEDERVVGFIRGFSDMVVASWITEIVISPARQKEGIGSLLLSRFIKDYSHTAIYAETFQGKESFFEKIGIIKRDKMVVCSRRGDGHNI